MEFWQYLNVCRLSAVFNTSIALYLGHFHSILGRDKMEQDSVGSSRRLSRPEVFRHSSFEFNPTIFSGRQTVQKQQWGIRSARWPTCTYILTAMELPSSQSHSALAGRWDRLHSYFAHIFRQRQRLHKKLMLKKMFLGACRCLWRCCWSLHGVQPVKRSWVYLLLYTQVQYLFTKSTSGWIILSPRFDTLLQVFRNCFLISRLFIDFCRQQKKK